MSGYLSEDELAAARAAVPIVCVDLVPRRQGGDGELQAGLVLRDMPGRDEPVWCHLGGRVRRDETLRTALLRHLHSTLTGVDVDLPADPQPAGVVQWFPTEQPLDADLRHGYDPRQHAVALVYAIPLRGEPGVVEGGEAQDFRWWPVTSIDDSRSDLWPGAALTVQRALAAH